MNKGIYTALVTPFDDNNEIDFISLAKILDKQISANVAGIVVCGTTAESPTLTAQEKEKLIDFCIAYAKPELEIWVGCGTNNTKTTIEELEVLNKKGIDGVLLSLPCYNKPNFLGLKKHIELCCTTSEHPIMLYNIPSRSGLKLSAAQLVELCQNKKIVAIKEASGNMELFFELVQKLPKVMIFSGNDPQFLMSLKLGSSGIVSVASNLFPRILNQIFVAHCSGLNMAAQKGFLHILPLLEALFVETNPVPIKYALEKFGLCSCSVRLPLGPLCNESMQKIDGVLLKLKNK